VELPFYTPTCLHDVDRKNFNPERIRRFLCRWRILLKWAEEIIHRALYRKHYWGITNMVIKLLIT